MARPTNPEFHKTRWSLVLEAGDEDSAIAKRALSELCEIYWQPLYGFLRRSGRTVQDAEDLTQEFLYEFLRREDFTKADRTKGRLRSYLLGALKHFLANHAARERAEKRGGGHPPISIPDITDWEAAEARFEQSVRATGALTPDQQFDRQWALAVLELALDRSCLAIGGESGDLAT